jgi:hypothetical protein
MITYFNFVIFIIAVDIINSFSNIQTSRFSNLSRFSDLIMKFGSHGTDFKYIPIHQGKERENFPRIVQIAGIYPELSPEDLLAPPPSLPVRRGTKLVIITSSLFNTYFRKLDLRFLRPRGTAARHRRAAGRRHHNGLCGPGGAHFDELSVRYQSGSRR